jgi:excisionase family DNA binding protein
VKAPAIPRADHRQVQPLVYTLEQVLEAVPGLSLSELYRQIRLGNLPSLKVGRRRAVRREDLEAWIDARSSCRHDNGARSGAPWPILQARDVGHGTSTL